MQKRTRAIAKGGIGLALLFGAVLLVLQLVFPSVPSPIQLILQGQSFLAQSMRPADTSLIDAEHELLSLRADVAGLQAERDELRALVQYKDRSSETLITTRIIGRDPSDVDGHWIIPLGSEEGMRAGNAVIAGDGILIGVIDSVFPHMATVRSVSHAESGIAASLLNQTRTIGLVEGIGGQLMRMSLIPQDEPLIVGDLVVSSGIETTIPSHLVIGTITSIEQLPEQPFQEAIIESPVSLERITHVSVLTKTIQ